MFTTSRPVTSFQQTQNEKADDIILIHDDRFNTRFVSGNIAVQDSNIKVNLKLTNTPANTLHSAYKNIIESNPEYVANSRFYTNPIFCHTDYYLDKDTTSVLVDGDVTNFVYRTNIMFKNFFSPTYAWRVFSQISQGWMNTSDNTYEITCLIRSAMGTISREQLIEYTISDLRWLSLRLGMGVSTAKGELPMKFYTNGGDYYVDHPTLYRVPGGLEYVDLTSWDGSDRDIVASDIKFTG